MVKAVYGDLVVRVIGSDDHYRADFLVLENLAVIGIIPFHAVLFGGGFGALLDDVDGVAKFHVGIFGQVGKMNVVCEPSATHDCGYDFCHNFLSSFRVIS